MTDAPQTSGQPQKFNARQVSRNVYIIDFVANVGIRVGGVFVVLAVLGMVAYIIWEVKPLFSPPAQGMVAMEGARPTPGRNMLVACDEYRRTVVRIDDGGNAQVVSALTGEKLHEARLEPFKDAGLTALWASARSTATISASIEASTSEHLMVAGSSTGEIWQGRISYDASYLRLPLNPPDDLLQRKGISPAEWKEIRTLETPEEQATKEASYAPKVLMVGSGDRRAVIEHLPNDFQFYRMMGARVDLPRKLEFPTDGAAIVDVGAAVEMLPEHDKPYELITGAITSKGRVLLKIENMSINPMSDEWEGEEAALVDLTRYITAGTPRFIRIRTQRDQCVVVTEDGKLYTFKRDKRDFVPEFPVDDVFKAVENKSWIEHVNAQRTGRGFAAATGAPRVTCVEFLIGDITLLIGDSLGGLQGWFSTKLNKDAPAGPLNRTRIHSPGAGAIAAIVMAQTQKSFVITDESGLVRAIHNTSEREFFNEKVAPGAVRACSPLKEEGFIAVAGDGRLHHWWVHAPHVDVSLGVLIAPVWYESYPGPVNHWESTTGSADVESKYSLVPLIIGTLKGGLYALLVAIPLALLGAVYTSEFMHRKMRAVVKPSMEIMASLPSVVLGFLAAMYFAPEAAPRMPTLIVAAFVCPGFFLLYGWMFQQLPPSIVSRFTPVVTTVALFLILMAGLGVSSLLGPRFEQVLFPAVESADPALVDARTFKPVSDEAARRLDTGDFRSWTSGGAELAQPASVRGETLPRGWWIPGGHTLFKFLMWIPFGLLLAWALKVFFAGGNFFSRPIKPVLPPSVFDLPSILNRARGAISGGRTAGLWPVVVNVGFSLAGVAVIGALAFGVSSLLSPMIEGLLFNYSHPTAGSVADFRRFVTGPEGWKYTQTNSLIVGFAMGFAVIPIIYSIAEDALSTVPNHMRAASLACGASRWQTTVRIVIPAAASGIFSAIVIGLGRAVGETMIVVMAAGGTPVMDMQPLVGFRSLSAAIATEIAEAADGSTHRRTLFLAGLVLFLMTFFMSTLAEFVRMRLRKKLNRM